MQELRRGGDALVEELEKSSGGAEKSSGAPTYPDDAGNDDGASLSFSQG